MKLPIKQLLRGLIVLVLLALAVAVALLLSRDFFLRRLTERRLTQATGLRTTIGSLKTELGSPTIWIRDLKLHNPPEFGDTVFLDVPELFLDLDAAAAAEGNLHFKQLRFHLGQLNLVAAGDGRLNLDVLEQRLATNASVLAPVSSLVGSNSPPAVEAGTSSWSGVSFGGIDHVQLWLGEVRFIDLGRTNRSRRISLNLTNEVANNLHTEQQLKSWLASLLVRIGWQLLLGEGSTNRPPLELILEETNSNAVNGSEAQTPPR